MKRKIEKDNLAARLNTKVMHHLQKSILRVEPYQVQYENYEALLR